MWFSYTYIIMLTFCRKHPPSPFPPNLADDFGHQKLAAQYIHRELREADEANLIDEKGMK